jgi:hypothetical protein
MRLLNRGDKGFEVAVAKRLMNMALKEPMPHRPAWFGEELVENDQFDIKMDKQVRALQSQTGLVADGYIGPKTWAMLGLRTAIQYDRMRQIGQKEPGLCWRAAAAMILGETPNIGYGVVLNKRNAIALEDERGQRTDKYLRKFIEMNFWRPMGPQFTHADLTQAMRGGPLFVAGVARGATREMGHAVVFSGLWSDGTPEGTLIRVHDPFPNNIGSVYLIEFGQIRVRKMHFEVWLIGAPPHGALAHHGTIEEFKQAPRPRR